MQFAINYSPQSAALVEAGQIEIDRFKCSEDWPNHIAAAQKLRPIYVHYNLRADPQDVAGLDVAFINRLRRETNTPDVNLHLLPRMQHVEPALQNADDPAALTAISDMMIAGVACVLEHFDPGEVILENVPFSGPGTNSIRACSLPSVIRRVVEETGCGFLLDIGHLRRAAHHLGLDEADYFAQMPTDRLREMHVAGLGDVDGMLKDHLPMDAGGWSALEFALSRIHAGEWSAPWIVTFEYGGEGPIFAWRSKTEVMAEQVPRLYEMVHNGH